MAFPASSSVLDKFLSANDAFSGLKRRICAKKHAVPGRADSMFVATTAPFGTSFEHDKPALSRSSDLLSSKIH